MKNGRTICDEMMTKSCYLYGLIEIQEFLIHFKLLVCSEFHETFRSVFRPIRNRIWPSELREMFFDPIQPLVGFNMVHWQGVDKKNVILFKTNRKSNLARLGMESF